VIFFFCNILKLDIEQPNPSFFPGKGVMLNAKSARDRRDKRKSESKTSIDFVMNANGKSGNGFTVSKRNDIAAKQRLRLLIITFKCLWRWPKRYVKNVSC
jgi:hypothetical protein